MRLAQITRPGLAAIALSVAVLWGCVVANHLTMRQALAERAQVMRQVVRSRQRMQPAGTPARFIHHPLHSTAS